MELEARDRIHIRDLEVRCILGILPEERREKQEVVINITLHTLSLIHISEPTRPY